MFTHPRDPYTRVDILPSSRHVRVELDGVTIAETTKPTLLFETGLPVRYYLPKTHVRMDLLTPTESDSHCPYKGRRRVLVGPRRRNGPRRPRMVVPDAASREPEDRRPGQLLHREGRRSTSTESSRLEPARVLLRTPLRATQATRRSSSIRSRTASSPQTRPAAICSATPARSCSRRRSPASTRASSSSSKPSSAESSNRDTAPRSRSPAASAQGTRLPIELSLWAFESAGRDTAARRSSTTEASTGADGSATEPPLSARTGVGATLAGRTHVEGAPPW